MELWAPTDSEIVLKASSVEFMSGSIMCLCLDWAALDQLLPSFWTSFLLLASFWLFLFVNGLCVRWPHFQ